MRNRIHEVKQSRQQKRVIETEVSTQHKERARTRKKQKKCEQESRGRERNKEKSINKEYEKPRNHKSKKDLTKIRTTLTDEVLQVNT